MKSKAIKKSSKIKFYADENMNIEYVNFLKKDLKINIKTTDELGNLGKDDKKQLFEADKRKRFLITCDKGFMDNKKYKLNTFRGIIVIDSNLVDINLGKIGWLFKRFIVPAETELIGKKILMYKNKCVIHGKDSKGIIRNKSINYDDFY
ncbi:MAG: hypothetical protein GY839_01200 [candidate division Zixibacteria bacterium]|nr:hypothetical protein [candidate division Zixibacteria bacterium]